MKSAVIGANGQLGVDVCEALRVAGHSVWELNHDRIRVEDLESVRSALGEAEVDVVINAAAMHNVPDCENDPEGAFRVNAVGTLNLARLTEESGSRLVHISTDYVFDGLKQEPYLEEDVPRPLNVYGASKLAGEHLALLYNERACVVRSSGLYGHAPCRAKGGRNFVETMQKIGQERGSVRVVDDERLTPTSTRELATQLVRICEAGTVGLVHATQSGSCTWFEFAEAVFELSAMTVDMTRVTAAEFGSPIRRPSYSVLENGRLSAADLDVMAPWWDALAEYIATQRQPA